MKDMPRGNNSENTLTNFKKSFSVINVPISTKFGTVHEKGSQVCHDILNRQKNNKMKITYKNYKQTCLYNQLYQLFYCLFLMWAMWPTSLLFSFIFLWVRGMYIYFFQQLWVIPEKCENFEHTWSTSLNTHQSNRDSTLRHTFANNQALP